MELDVEGDELNTNGSRTVSSIQSEAPRRMAAGLSCDQLERRLAEPVKNEPRVARSLAGRDLEDLALDVLVNLARM